MAADRKKYDDIIHLPHPVSRKHPQMDLADRAAQFSPFAALTGYEAAVKETARLTSQRIELDEDRKAALDERLRMLQQLTGGTPEIRITCFQEDDRKEGGVYVNISGRLKKVDSYERCLVMEDGRKIRIEDVTEIEECPDS